MSNYNMIDYIKDNKIDVPHLLFEIETSGPTRELLMAYSYDDFADFGYYQMLSIMTKFRWCVDIRKDLKKVYDYLINELNGGNDLDNYGWGYQVQE